MKQPLIIIGEKINSSIQRVHQAIAEKDRDFIVELAKQQQEGGADYIDVNAGMFQQTEGETLCWLLEGVRQGSSLPLCIDSPSCAAMEQVLSIYQGRKPILNSITLEERRFAPMLGLVRRYQTAVVALCMDDRPMREEAGEILDIALRLVEGLTSQGVALEDIYLDPMVRPLSTDSDCGKVVLDTIAGIRKNIPEVHIVCGLSNISYGLPKRRYINRAFLVAAMANGLDAAIADPLDVEMMSLCRAASAVLGEDEYCMDYLDAYREGLLG